MIARVIKTSLASMLVLLVLLSSFSFNIPKASASAVNGLTTNWQAGNIISDYVMSNTSTMSVEAIQYFFNIRGSVCLQTYQTPDPLGNNNYGGNVSAAQAIYDAARVNGINPQVLLVLLQKEQGLITRQSCPQNVYDIATGYGCPDSIPTCTESAYGFSKQLYKAARFFRIDMDTPSDSNYPPGVATVQYSPNGACGSSTVNIINRATSALYDYTPYQPNFSALAAGYGIGDGCSAYGNRNFYLYFTDWFGQPNGSGVAHAIADNGDPRQWLISSSGYRYYIPSTEVATAWGLTGAPVALSANYLGAFRDGPTISRSTRDPSSGALYLVDGGYRYHYTTFNQVSAWNDGNFSNVDPAIVNYYLRDGGDLDYSVKFSGNDAIYMVDGGVLRQYASIPIIQSIDTYTRTITMDPTVMSRFLVGSPITTNKIRMNGTDFMMDAGRKMALDTNLSAMYPGAAQTVSIISTNRMPDIASSYFVKAASNDAVYLVDNGVKRHVKGMVTYQAFSKNRNPGFATILSDAAINSLIPTGTDLTTPYVTDGANQYIMDGRAVRIPAALRPAYIGSHSLDATNVSAALVQYMGTVTAQPFLAVGDGRILIIDGSTKRWIANLPTFLALSDPATREVTTLSQSIFDGIADGNSITKPFVTNQGITYYLEANKSYVIDSQHSKDWGGQTTTPVGNDVVARYVATGNLSNHISIGSQRYLVNNGSSYADNRNYILLWSSDAVQSHDNVALSFLTQRGDLSIFARSTDSSDNRIFAKDDNKVIQLTGITQLQNLAGSNSLNTVLLTPSDLTNLNPVASSMITVSTAGQTQLIISGGRYNFTDAPTQQAWTQADTLSIGNNLASQLPQQSVIITSVAQTVSQSNIYAVVDGSTHWIYYAPYISRYRNTPVTTISDKLMRSLPQGPAIQN